MSIIKNHIKGGGEASLPPFYSHKIGQSLRFNDDDSANLSKTFASSGNRQKWTFSWFGKLGALVRGRIFGSDDGGTSQNSLYLRMETDGQLRLGGELGNSTNPNIQTEAQYRDPTAWGQFVVAFDSTEPNSDDRLKIWYNGKLESLVITTEITQNVEHWINHNANQHTIGGGSTNTQMYDGYLADIWFIDGQALTADDFGELKNNVWIPKAYLGSVTGNSFHLDFADSSDIGKDVSGNNNDLTVNNLVSSDVVLDSPTNNFCTLNPLVTSNHPNGSLSQGNLRFDATTSGGNHLTTGTYYLDSGKWYVEYYAVNASTGDSTSSFGLCDGNDVNVNSAIYKANGSTQGIVGNPSFNTYSSGDVIGFMVDFDLGEIAFYKNGVQQGSGVYSIDDSYTLYTVRVFLDNVTSRAGIVNFGQDSSFVGLTTKGGFTDSNGNGDFKYEPPVGALALCTDNLPETVFSPSTGYAQREVVPISYFVDNALRANEADDAHLTRTPSSETNRQTWTWSGWIKRSSLVYSGLFSAYTDANNRFAFYLNATNELQIWSEQGGVDCTHVTSNTFTDTDEFMHVVLAYDTSETNVEDRTKIWVNGVLQSIITTRDIPLNRNDEINAVALHGLCTNSNGLSSDLYIAETHFIDGEALTSDDFGEVRNGEWVPKQYTDGYGTNGFYLNFADDQDIGGDLSGNDNDWTPINLSDHDVVEDGPSDNYNTFDPIETYGTTGEGNLQTTNGSTKPRGVFGNQIMTTGKWYAEAFFDSFTTQNTANLGIVPKDFDGLDSAADIIPANSTDGVTYLATDGNKYVDNVKTGYGTTFSSGDLISIIVDVDEDTVEFKVNNVSQGIINKALSSNGYKFFHAHGGNGTSTFIWNFGQDSTFAGTVPTGSDNATDANGKGDFYYAPPEGALALTESNLPDTTVEPLGLCEDNFDITLWLADGNAQTVSGLTFAPDFSWLKKRSDVGSHTLVDIVRGEESRLFSDTTDSELSNTGFTLNSDGFTTTSAESQAEAGRTFVAWNWKMGGAGVINNDGSVQSIVSANVEAGQSVVGYENIPSMTTVGHGLSKPIEFAFAKNIDSSNSWNVYHKSIGKDNRLQLNTTAASASSSAWLNTDPTEEVLSIRLSPTATFDAIVYCFHSVEGYSKFGSYEGNGNTNGPFIYLGFKARYLLVKTTSSGSWKVWDTERSPHNLVDVNLTPNDNVAESVFDDIDILSNGIKIRTSNSTRNANGETFIYAAFAENPFKYSNAR